MKEPIKQQKPKKPEQQFQIQRVFVRDLSFEAPLGIKAFTIKKQPEISQELSTAANLVEDDIYESVLKIAISAKVEDEVIFALDILQSGAFLIKGFDEDGLTRMLNTSCPQNLYPYAREVIDSTLQKGGYPPLLLPHVNFKSLYAKAMADKNKNKDGGQKTH